MPELIPLQSLLGKLRRVSPFPTMKAGRTKRKLGGTTVVEVK